MEHLAEDFEGVYMCRFRSIYILGVPVKVEDVPGYPPNFLGRYVHSETSERIE